MEVCADGVHTVVCAISGQASDVHINVSKERSAPTGGRGCCIERYYTHGPRIPITTRRFPDRFKK